jgi:outer membrane immunogenic protein
MLRKLLLSSLAASTMVGSALAADLPRRAPPPPYVPPAPVATWTGLYIGINGGGLWMNNRDFVTTGIDFGGTGFAPSWSSAAALAATNVITINNRAQGLIGGTWGYNWQWNSFVVGTESDFDGVLGCRNNNNNNGNFGFFGSNNNDTCGGTAIGLAPVGPPVGPGFSIQNQQAITRSLDWLSTSRVRAGFLVTPSLLIYGTGGVAFGRVRVDSAIISSSTPFGPGGPALVTAPGFSVLKDSRLRAGFVGGGGFEWQLGTFGLFNSPFFRDLSFKAEALYYDLGRSTLDTLVQQNRAGILNTNTGIHTTWRNNGVIARAGINYRIHWFDAAPIAPVVARY